VVILVGLGNPGSEYSGTRHNIGFEIVDRAAAALGMRFRSGSGEYTIAEGSMGERALALVKPMTYMNNSGTAVADIMRRNGSTPAEIVVISDDFHLPLGTLRLRLKGSAGGHNGLRSIIEELGTEEFPRLRCGIAGSTLPADKSDMKEYVLRPFERDEQGAVDAMVADALRFLRLIIEEGPTQAQQKFNHTT